LVTISDF